MVLTSTLPVFEPYTGRKVVLGGDRDIGTIEAGKQADLVLVAGDPEQDIRQLRRMEIVFKQGVGFDSPKLFESMKGKVGLN